MHGNTGIEIRVLWTITAYKIGAGATWGEKEARSFLFKPLDINLSSITFDGKICQGVSFAKEIVNTDQYLSERYQMSRKVLGISNTTMEVVKTNCRLPGFSEYMRLKDRRLIVWIEGVFFIFEQNVNR